MVARTKLLFIFCFLLIFLFSAVTKISNLGQSSLDFDEIYSVKTANSPWWKIALGIRYDPGNPPLYFMILKAWKSLTGESEFRLRALSVIFHLIALVSLYLQAKKYLTKTSTLIVILLFSSSGLIFFHSRYLRAYSLIVLVSVSLFPLLLASIEKSKSGWLKVSLAWLLSLIGLYSHYSFIIFYFFLFLTFLFNCWHDKKKLGRLFKFTYLVILGYLPWAIYFLLSQISPLAWWHKYKFGQLGEEWVGFPGWLSAFTNNLSRNLPSVRLQTLSCVLLLLIFDYLLIKLYLLEKNLWKKSVLLLFLLSLNTLMFTPLHRIFNDPKYSLYLLPFAFLSFGILIDSLKRKIIKYLIFALVVTFSLLTYSSYKAPVLEDWRSLAKRIPRGEKGSVILFHPCHLGFSFDYYYKGSLPKYCFFENPEGMYLKIWDQTRSPTLYLVKRPGEALALLEKLSNEYSYQQEGFGNIELVILRKPSLSH